MSLNPSLTFENKSTKKCLGSGVLDHTLDFLHKSQEETIVHMDDMLENKGCITKDSLKTTANNYIDDNMFRITRNTDKFRQNANESRNTRICLSEHKTFSSDLDQKSSSYGKEFERFLRHYEENRYYDDSTVMDIKPNVSETEDYIHLSESINLGDSSVSDLTLLNINKSDDIDNSKIPNEEPINYFDIKIDETVRKDGIYSYEINDYTKDVLNKDKMGVEENNSIISISSESSQESLEKIQLDDTIFNISTIGINFIDEDSDNESYNSSDFELITEQEACLEGILNNGNTCSSSNDLKYNYFKTIDEDVFSFDTPGPSRSEFKFNKIESNIGQLTSRSDSDTEELNNHIIPEGEDFYELFSEPWTVYNFQAENKAFYSNRAMHFDTDNIGFNVGVLNQRHQENEVDDSVKEEASENAKKIISMYPSENKKRRQLSLR